jgi:threonyl-tRNA synthetase
MDYCRSVHKQLRAAGIRAEIDDRNEKIGKKIRDTELSKVPYMFIIGEKEMNENAVSLRIQSQGDQGMKPVTEIVESMREQILNRTSS